MALAAFVALVAAGRPAPAQDPAPAADPVFVENRGAWPPAVRYAVLGGPTRAWVTDDGFRVRVERRAADDPATAVGAVLRFRCGDGAAAVRPGPAAGVAHRVFRRGDAGGSGTARESVRLVRAWPGVDVRLRADPLGGPTGALAYDLLCDSVDRLAAVEVEVDGAVAIRRLDDGRLGTAVELGDGRRIELFQRAPVSWIVAADGERRAVDVDFEVRGARRFGFRVRTPAVDAGLPLVVDPGLAWSTFVGGGASDEAYDVEHRAGAGTWVAGWAGSSDFPATAGAWRAVGALDAFVARFDDAGRLAWASYFGGSEADEARALAVAADGAVWIGGWTSSTDLPVTVDAFQPDFGGRNPLFRIGDGFVTRLSADGARLEYASFLGGNGDDFVQALDVAVDGVLTIAGYTDSTNFPVTAGAAQTGFGSASQLVPDGFVARFTPGGTELIWSTYLGGSILDYLLAMDVADDGSVVVGGWTASPDFPVTPGAFQSSPRGDFDGFVARIAADGSRLLAATYLGGDGPDQVRGVAAGPGGEIFATGVVREAVGSFPVSADGYRTAPAGGQDAFVARVSNDGRRLRRATLLGGSRDDRGDAIARVGDRVVVAGLAGAADFGIGPAAVQPAFGGGDVDAFVAWFDLDLRGGLGATFFGGAATDRAAALSVDAATWSVTIAGGTFSADLPVTLDAPQPTFGGASDAFVARLDVGVDRGAIRAVVVDAATPPTRVVAAGADVLALAVEWRGEGVEALLATHADLALGCVDAPLDAVVARLDVFEDVDGDGLVGPGDRVVGAWLPRAATADRARVELGATPIAPGGSVTWLVQARLAPTAPPGAELQVAVDPWGVGAASLTGDGRGAGVTLEGPGAGARVVVAAAREFLPDVDGDGRVDVGDVRRLVTGAGVTSSEPGFDADGDGEIGAVDALAAVDRVLERPVVLAVAGRVERGGVLCIRGFGLERDGVALEIGGVALPVLARTPRQLLCAVPFGVAAGRQEVVVTARPAGGSGPAAGVVQRRPLGLVEVVDRP